MNKKTKIIRHKPIRIERTNKGKTIMFICQDKRTADLIDKMFSTFKEWSIVQHEPYNEYII